MANTSAAHTPIRRRRGVLLIITMALIAAASVGVWLPVFGPDRKLDYQLASLQFVIDHSRDEFDNLSSASRSPYGAISKMEVRLHERRSVVDVLSGRDPGAVILLSTERGLVVERVSCADLESGRFATLHHMELSPDDVPPRILTEAERMDHRASFELRGGTAAEYTSGGFDG